MFTKDSRILNRMLKAPLTSMYNPVGDVFKKYSQGGNPPYGDWILNQGYEIVGNDIKYTGYKTNGLNYYDSFALADLVQTLVKSFNDPDLQQYVAFTTAVEQLIGAVDWVLDPTNNQIKYSDPNSPDAPLPPHQKVWIMADFGYQPSSDDVLQWASSSQYGACTLATQLYSNYPVLNTIDQVNSTAAICRLESQNGVYKIGITINLVDNPTYDPEAIEEQKTLPLDVVAQQVISNTQSSEDEVLKLLSEDYINLVAESIFNIDTSKQFVKLEDLIPQLEANEVLRS